jgi:uncharacterized protein
LIFNYLKVEKPFSFSENIKAHSIELGYHYEALVDPLVFEIDASPIKDGCHLNCKFQYSITLPCARCLEDVELSGITNFMVELKQKVGGAPTVVKEEEDDDTQDIDEIFLEDELFETKTLVDEQLIFLLPERILCKDDCKGICPNCGKNRNKEECDCQVEIDPRWSPLSKISK